MTAVITHRRSQVMGTAMHVLLVEPSPVARVYIMARLADLEASWSRFRSDSDVSRLNSAHGAPVPVNRDTRHLLRVGTELWRMTRGRLDPTVLPALRQAGYDRTFDEVADGAGQMGAGLPAPGLAGLRIDDDRGIASLPYGVEFDPGGFGKGLAADLVVEEILGSELATGVLLNLGGDLRAAGTPPEGGWGIALDDPMGTSIGLTAGAVATSTISRRHWRGPDGTPRHHVVDPSTGTPADTAFRSVTVVAPSATQAEALATWMLLAPGEAGQELERYHAAALAVSVDGAVSYHARMEDFLC